jgi:hypothetical protein
MLSLAVIASVSQSVELGALPRSTATLIGYTLVCGTIVLAGMALYNNVIKRLFGRVRDRCRRFGKK